MQLSPKELPHCSTILIINILTVISTKPMIDSPTQTMKKQKTAIEIMPTLLNA